MSIAFDCFWWWRSEFDGRSSPCRSPEAILRNEDYVATATVREEAFSGELDPNMTLYSDLYTISPSSLDFANWHWPAGLTFDDGHMPLPALY